MRNILAAIAGTFGTWWSETPPKDTKKMVDVSSWGQPLKRGNHRVKADSKRDTNKRHRRV